MPVAAPVAAPVADRPVAVAQATPADRADAGAIEIDVDAPRAGPRASARPRPPHLDPRPAGLDPPRAPPGGTVTLGSPRDAAPAADLGDAAGMSGDAAYDAGKQAYDAGEYDDARRYFARAADAGYRAPLFETSPQRYLRIIDDQQQANARRNVRDAAAQQDAAMAPGDGARDGRAGRPAAGAGRRRPRRLDRRHHPRGERHHHPAPRRRR